MSRQLLPGRAGGGNEDSLLEERVFAQLTESGRLLLGQLDAVLSVDGRFPLNAWLSAEAAL